MLKKITTAGLAVVLAMALAATASAKGHHQHHNHHKRTNHKHLIVLYKSVGPIKLGMTVKQVKRALGKPSHTARVSGKIASLDFAKRNLSVQFDTLHKPEVVNFVAPDGGVTSGAARYHTARGIHMGSSVKALKRAYGKRLKHVPGALVLYKGRPGSYGSTRTDFGTFHGHVEEIDVQKVFKDI